MADSKPPPPLAALALLTIVAGVGDAISYLGLGNVFVANMTGNVVFLGFAASGDDTLSVPASLVALAAFLAGSLIAGALARRLSPREGLKRSLALQLVAVAVALVVVLAAGHTGDVRYALIAVLAVALGLQNAGVRALAVPDMTTTVLTLTLTGLAADSTLAGGTNPRWARRVSAVALMLGGAVIGGLLVLHAGMAEALAVMLVTVGIANALTLRT